MEAPKSIHERIRLVEINSYLTCRLCKGYLIDATTISECLHSFCRSCIIKFLQENSHCPICEVMINKAKPNIKLDKTLQDIVYKLVPELFVREMLRRRRFYQRHPEAAAATTSEGRGQDTERTIFNPNDTISLSIEYIRDDSTPGAIQLLGSKGDQGKNGTSSDQDGAIKRFLQCPGMCRVDVLKKFVRNKYNVDTKLFYIDILYKRVPLPDHYTLIDIAYIYSWKRNEPMKFFFRITDVNLITDRFDSVPEMLPIPTPTKPSRTKIDKTPRVSKKVENRYSNKSKVKKEEDNKTNKEIKQEVKSRTEQEKSSSKNQVYTNITLNRSNNAEVVTKLEKTAAKNGESLKQPAKKTKPSPKIDATHNKPREETKVPIAVKEEKTESKRDLAKVEDAKIDVDLDVEKSNFLKSIELTAKSALPDKSPQKLALPAKSPPKLTLPAKSSPKLTLPAKSPPKIEPSASPTKRKLPSPSKGEKPAKKSKIDRSLIKNPAVRQMVSNVNQNVTNVSKIVEQNSPLKSTAQDLQSLFDSCKINIPSSLSITLKESNGEDKEAGGPAPMKPVQNYIEILKLPDAAANEEPIAKVPKTEEVKKLDEAPAKPAPKVVAMSPLHAPKLPSSPRESLAKLNPRTPQTFQKMFEEAIRKPEFSRKIQGKDDGRKAQKCALDLTTGENGTNGNKRNILEIASQLYKKTKLEHEKNGLMNGIGEMKADGVKTPVSSRMTPTNPAEKTNEGTKTPIRPLEKPNEGVKSMKDLRSPPNAQFSQTVTNLHSTTLGMNYSVSVGKTNGDGVKTSPTQVETKTASPLPRNKEESPSRVNKASPSPKSVNGVVGGHKATQKPAQTPPKAILPKPASNMTVTTTTGNLNPNQILEKYNIQNLAQLTASFNFNPSNFGLNSVGQLAALQQAMIYKHFEMQNRQNWLNMNPNPLVQYEKYLQTLSSQAGQGGKPLLGSVVKEN